MINEAGMETHLQQRLKHQRAGQKWTLAPYWALVLLHLIIMHHANVKVCCCRDKLKYVVCESRKLTSEKCSWPQINLKPKKLPEPK